MRYMPLAVPPIKLLIERGQSWALAVNSKVPYIYAVYIAVSL